MYLNKKKHHKIKQCTQQIDGHISFLRHENCQCQGLQTFNPLKALFFVTFVWPEARAANEEEEPSSSLAKEPKQRRQKENETRKSCGEIRRNGEEEKTLG